VGDGTRPERRLLCDVGPGDPMIVTARSLHLRFCQVSGRHRQVSGVWFGDPVGGRVSVPNDLASRFDLRRRRGAKAGFKVKLGCQAFRAALNLFPILAAADRRCTTESLRPVRHCRRGLRGLGKCRPARRDQASTPQAIVLRSNAMNAALSHEPRKVSGVVSTGSAVRPARMAGLWQWPRAK
jgi:hypothetical protein